MKDYVLLARHSRFWLVGPFPDFDAAVKWGRETQTNGNDDPRWQTVSLDPATLEAPPAVFTPDDPYGIENGEPD